MACSSNEGSQHCHEVVSETDGFTVQGFYSSVIEE